MSNKPHILILDDIEDAASATVLWFRMHEWHVDLASTVDAAKSFYEHKIVTTHPYDVFLLDLAMPPNTGGSGLAFAEWIRERERAGKCEKPANIVFYTGHDNERSRERAKSIGAAGYYIKPVMLDDLEAALIEAIES